ncbi:MAG: Crp/Fnr family transcriptional regulator [Candidatus Competibacteraceae bacterium]|nr:Crp/Fnr family transcriptional regulator [Candidatus Competibacteraceae bacterium]
MITREEKNLNGLCEAMKDVLNYSPSDLKDYFHKSVELRHYGPNDLLFDQGDDPCGIFSIYQGSVKLSRYSGKKNKQIVLLASKNEMMGISAIFNKHPLLYTAHAMEPTQVCYLPIDQANHLAQTNPLVLVPLMNKVNEAIEELERHTALVMSCDANTVVIKTLQNLQQKFGSDSHGFININLPARDLANYVCMSKTNLYRALNYLKEKMIITYETNRYKIFHFE